MQQPAPHLPEEMVDETSDESFPASDPPAWTAIHVGSPMPRPPIVAHGHELRSSLRADVQRLESTWIGPARAPSAVEDFVAGAMLDAGHPVMRTLADDQGRMHNVECMLQGAEPQAPTLVVGARFDRRDESGVAMLLAVLRALGASQTRRPLRFVAVASAAAGARYASRLREEGVGVSAIVSLGPLDLARGSRRAGAFIVGNLSSAATLRSARDAFRAATWIPARAVWLPKWWPGFASAERATFGALGWPFISIRDSRAHDRRRVPDVDRMAATVPGVLAAVVRLAGGRV